MNLYVMYILIKINLIKITFFGNYFGYSIKNDLPTTLAISFECVYCISMKDFRTVIRPYLSFSIISTLILFEPCLSYSTYVYYFVL